MGLERAETDPARLALWLLQLKGVLGVGLRPSVVLLTRLDCPILPILPGGPGPPWPGRTESTRISILAGRAPPGCPVRPDTCQTGPSRAECSRNKEAVARTSTSEIVGCGDGTMDCGWWLAGGQDDLRSVLSCKDVVIARSPYTGGRSRFAKESVAYAQTEMVAWRPACRPS